MASGATIGSAVVKLEFDGSEVKASLQGFSKDMKRAGKDGGVGFSNAWTVAVGNLIANGLSKITSTITSNLDTAIARVDTLNNSQKVFTAMGYSADATSKSMETLTSYLDGLPTSMTSAVQNVQSLSASFGGIEKGTQTFIDMNNAGLAFGATAEMIDNAILQLGQLSLDGPLDAGTWRSLQNSGFAPVFAAMAKDAGVTVGELKEEFGGNGTKTVGEFLDALHRLNTEGGGDMESLASLARKNTDGIGTALENVQNRIGKAIAKVIDHIGASNISGIINDISSHFTDLADGVIGAIDWIMGNWDLVSEILKIVGAFFAGLLAMNIASKVQAFFTMLSVFASTNPILLAIGGIVAVIVLVLTHLEELKTVLGEVGKFFGMVFGAIGETIGAVVSPIINAIQTITGAIVGFWQTVIGLVASFVQMIWDNGLGKIIEFVVNIWIAIVAILATVAEWIWNNVQLPIINFVANTVGVIVGFIIGLWNTIAGVIGVIAGWIWNNVQLPIIKFVTGLVNTVVGTVTNFVGTVTRIVGTIVGWINANIITPIGNFFKGLWNGITSGVKAMAEGVKNVFKTIVGFIKAPINGIINGVNSVIDGINSITVPDWVPVIGGAHANFPHVPTLAQGGYAGNGATGAVIGEAGKEVVLPLEQNTDNWAGLLAGTLAEQFEKDETVGGRDIVMNNTFEINNEMDADDIGRVLMQSIRRSA